MSILKKQFLNHQGVDTTSDEITRNEAYLSDMRNAEYTRRNRFRKRKGFKAVASVAEPCGSFTYRKKNSSTGVVSEEVLVACTDGHLRKMVESSIAISYSGLSTTVTANIIWSTSLSAWTLVFADGSTVLNTINLGSGLEASPITLANLEVTIDALADFEATVTGTTTVPAAFLELTRKLPLTSSINATIKAYSFSVIPWEWSQYSVADSDATKRPLQGCRRNKDEEDFEGATFVQQNNVVYIADGHMLKKYDGNRIYYAGIIPPCNAEATTQATGGSLTAGYYGWRFSVLFIDNQGNEVESDISPYTSNTSFQTVSGSSSGEFGFLFGPFTTLSSAYPLIHGLPNYMYRVRSAGTGVNTLTLASDHTFLVGDTVYFFDGASSAYVARKVTAVASTTITIDGAVVNVTTSTMISPNLRLRVWRTTVQASLAAAGTASIYLSKEVPFGARAEAPSGSQFYAYELSGQKLVDGTADADLGIQWEDPEVQKQRTFPACKYVSKFRSQLVTAGRPSGPSLTHLLTYAPPNYLQQIGGEFDDVQIQNENVVNWSDVLSPEQTLRTGQTEEEFSDDRNETETPISGISETTSDFLVFKENSVFVLGGSIETNDITIRRLDTSKGCAAHNSIRNVNGKILYLSYDGVYAINAGQLPERVGYPVEGFLTKETGIPYPRYLLKKAMALNFGTNSQYLLFIPRENQYVSTMKYPDSESVVLVYDYQKEDRWLIWKDLNMQGGATIFNKNILTMSRQSDGKHVAQMRSKTGTKYDYQDHTAAVTAYFDTAWYNEGDPEVFRKIAMLAVKCIELTPENTFTLTIEQYKDWVTESIAASTTLSFLSDPASAELHQQTNVYEGKVRSSKFRFKNSEANQTFDIQGWTVEWDPSFEEELKE